MHTTFTAEITYTRLNNITHRVKCFIHISRYLHKRDMRVAYCIALNRYSRFCFYFSWILALVRNKGKLKFSYLAINYFHCNKQLLEKSMRGPVLSADAELTITQQLAVSSTHCIYYTIHVDGRLYDTNKHSLPLRMYIVQSCFSTSNI